MQVDRVGDPAEFAGRAAPLLLRDEARHALQLGLCTTLVERPDVYPENRLWLVRAEGVVVVVGMLTPPFNMTVSRPDAEDALAALAAAVHEDGLVIPGVTGAVPEVEGFVEAWRERTGAGAHRAMSQRIYRLSSVRTVTAVRGLMRRAKQGDRELLIEWMAAFAVEALPADSPTNAERVVDLRLQGGKAGLFLWEDREPVSIVGYGGYTPNGARIGPVYTPPAFRRRGYASALTAGVSQWLLESGRRFCFLYTDLSNPTSNRIYQDIGYEPACDSAEYRFEPGPR